MGAESRIGAIGRKVPHSGWKIRGSGEATHVGARLHGSLAFTGRVHATDRAVILGRAGFAPSAFAADRATTSAPSRPSPPLRSHSATTARISRRSTPAIETMHQTGRDILEKYKESSLDGLAVNVPLC